MARFSRPAGGYLLVIAQEELDPELRAKGGASDLVQETLLHALRGFPRFQGDTEGELLAWLRRVLLNNLADFTRLYRATEKRQASREVALDAGSAGAHRRLASSGPSPSGHAMGQEQLKAVTRALEGLPEDYRQVLLLRYQEQFSFEDIGRLMGRSPNAARKLWLRAIEQLQHVLAGPS